MFLPNGNFTSTIFATANKTEPNLTAGPLPVHWELCYQIQPSV